MTKSKGFVKIQWQDGVVTENGVNGAQINDMLSVALERLQVLNKQYPCRENSITITKLEEAMM
ncbi:hypothetical protein HB825_05875 [Listeria booriae]|uniref:Acb2/Tad1 hairpin domain-containing protein n=1 Tax=Listeria booriae TaxID=1552123 RepID=A0A7X0XAJ6_9LIST|nr:hypothetical protein [Listeria booriae]MBC1490659.1 hypothetical protein [Listeria booriae]MBC1503805.1 hypothetical protein [Listeria booriae]MBC1524756.1 hypothetical protein [Listeria booriae]MBC1530464.1 hypothetical protein [Listeria booriae]MBC6134361.1 hypothetical protein [Listeria booriae]